MKRLFILCLAAVTLSQLVNAQPQTVEWTGVYGGTGFESMWAEIPITGGRYLIAGETTSFGVGLDDFWVKMLDASGNSIWTRAYGTPARDVCTYAIHTSDGGFALVGPRGIPDVNPDTTQGWLIKLNANGDSVWSRVFGGAGGDWPYWIEQTSDGGYIIAGTENSFGNGSWDAWLVKMDAGGAIQWQKSYGGPNVEDAICVRVAPDGGYILAGDTRSFGAGDYDAWLLKTNANGDSLWSRTFGDNLTQGFYTLDVTSDGGYLLIGYTDSLYVPSTDSWYIVKTDNLGQTQWERRFGGFGTDAPWGGQQTSDGGYIVGGYMEYPDSNGIDLTALKLDASGDSMWAFRYPGDGYDYGWFASVTPDGGYLLGADTYSSWSHGDADWLVVKTQTECPDPTPLPPQIVITRQGANAVLHWNPVTQSVANCAINPTHYLIFHSETVGGPYYYHGYTADTSYVHVGALAYENQHFYYALASTAPLPVLEQLPQGQNTLTEAEVMRLLAQSPPPAVHSRPAQFSSAPPESPLFRRLERTHGPHR